MTTLFMPARDPELSLDDLHRLLESVDDHAFFLLDGEGRVASWNRGAERVLRHRAEQIVGAPLATFHPAAEHAGAARLLELARETGRAESEGARLRGDGTTLWASVVLTALRGADGRLRGYLCVLRDVTARHAAEEARRGSEERLRLMIEAVTDYAIYMLDPEGRITTWNTGAERIKGYTEREVLGKDFAMFFPEEDRRAGRPRHELAMALANGRFEEEGTRVRKDGSHFCASVVVTPVRDAGGELLGFAKVTRDLTARVEAERSARRLATEQAARAAAERAEERLRESEQRYRSLSERLHVILEGLADGITVQDRTGARLFANTAAARAAGFATVEEFVAAAPEQVLARFELRDEHGEIIPPEAIPGRRVLQGESACSLLMHVRDRATGEAVWRHVRSTAVLGPDGATELAITLWDDVTESRRREQHESYLAQATAALARSLDYAVTLSTLAEQLVPELADWCAIHLLEADQLALVAVSHVDPERVRFARELHERYPPRTDRPQGVWNVLRTGRSELHPEIPDALIAATAHDAEHLAVLRAVGMRSAILVPIRVRERVLGTISLISAQPGRRYDASEVALAEELGRRAGSAIDNARLYTAERKARGRLALLARAGESFAEAASYEDMLRSVVELALPALGDFAIFDVLEGSEVRRITAAHDDPEVDALLAETRFRPARCPTRNVCALTSGRPGFEPLIDDAVLSDIAESSEHLAFLRRLALGSLVTVPLSARGELLGALTVCFGKSGRHHTPEDLELAEELARRAAISMAQVQLYARAQEAARSAEEAARRAEEANRVKDEFLATVSHELRTPLNAILGWAALLRARGPDPTAAKPIEIIHRNALAQGKIIEDILDVSRIITGKLRLDIRPTDLASIVRDAIEVIRPSAVAKRLAIELVLSTEDSVLSADPERLQQVVWNLLSNAVKFSDPDGRIRIEIVREGAKLVLCVHDTGRGIEPDFLPYVFDRFKQADGSTTRRVGGLGLGLAIVRHVVELHGGYVEAQSAGSGKGATFRVTLPVGDPDGIAAPPRVEAQPAAELPAPRPAVRPLEGARVLVVDDELDARELLDVMLSEAGAEVETASSAAQGLARLRTFSPHVLVSDVGMPEEDGYSFVRRVRALEGALSAIPSVALTAYTRPDDRERALAAGFTQHLGKPVQAEALIELVARLWRERR